MDSLTQLVLGAAVAEVVAGKKMGNRAALWGAIAGTIPDLDVIPRAMMHPFDGALVHRGFSHSILFALIAAPILAYFCQHLYKSRYSAKLWIHLFFWSIITHPMLDIFTSYGTQFFWPFDLRLTFNSVFVIDPLYTLPFLVCLLIALFLNKESRKRRVINHTGIILSSLYLIWCSGVKLVVLNQSEQLFQSAGITGKRNLVTPMPFTSFYWMMMTEDKGSYYLAYKSIFYPLNKDDIDTIPKKHDLLNQVKWREKDYSATIRFLTNGYFAMEKRKDTIVMHDLRFGMSSQATDGKIRTPIMSYGMVIDKGMVIKTAHLPNKAMFNAINFTAYFEKIIHP